MSEPKLKSFEISKTGCLGGLSEGQGEQGWRRG